MKKKFGVDKEFVGCRLDKKYVSKLDDLMIYVAISTQYGKSRSDVMRVALQIGLDKLEADKIEADKKS